jgi:IS4 transposase
MVLTDGKTRETVVARQQQFVPGTILLFDRGYMNFRWYWALTQAGVFFVTRLRVNARYEVVERRAVPRARGILRDEVIRFHGKMTRYKYRGLLRRVVYQTPEGERLEFLTNHLTWGATTIARLYKERWQIELFFKALKQHLRVKTFVGTSANALRVQIWTALIALLLLKYLQLRARFGWSLSNLVALLRMNLFVYRDLWRWIDDPFTAPPLLPEPEQVRLGFS